MPATFIHSDAKDGNYLIHPQLHRYCCGQRWTPVLNNTCAEQEMIALLQVIESPLVPMKQAIFIEQPDGYVCQPP